MKFLVVVLAFAGEHLRQSRRATESWLPGTFRGCRHMSGEATEPKCGRESKSKDGYPSLLELSKPGDRNINQAAETQDR